MAFNIHDFKANGLLYGGARPALLQVLLTIPTFVPEIGTADIQKISFLAKGASVPPQDLGSVDVFYFGRPVKYNGDRTYPDWTITIINDEDYAIRRALEGWSNQINTSISNWQTAAAFTGQAYKSTAEITAMGKAGDPLATYQFEGIWPKLVEPMNMNWEMVNQVQEFDVTFAYDLWIPVAPDAGTGTVGGGGGVPVAAQFTGLE